MTKNPNQYLPSLEDFPLHFWLVTFNRDTGMTSIQFRERELHHFNHKMVAQTTWRTGLAPTEGELVLKATEMMCDFEACRLLGVSLVSSDA